MCIPCMQIVLFPPHFFVGQILQIFAGQRGVNEFSQDILDFSFKLKV